jgi:hypothetical protein
MKSPACILALFLGLSGMVYAQTPDYCWAELVPENDSRPEVNRQFDDLASRQLVRDMNHAENVFQHRLVWKQVSTLHLLSASVPFCQFNFDPVHPQVLTAREKKILKEYFRRGGVILLREGIYSYTPEEILGIKQWPVIDFLTKELPAEDPHFTVEKATENHPIFHQSYNTQLPLPEKQAIHDFPNLPDLTILSYKGRLCAFVYATYFCNGQKPITVRPPYPTNFYEVPEDFALWVNLYVYSTTH